MSLGLEFTYMRLVCIYSTHSTSEWNVVKRAQFGVVIAEESWRVIRRLIPVVGLVLRYLKLGQIDGIRELTIAAE